MIDIRSAKFWIPIAAGIVLAISIATFVPRGHEPSEAEVWEAIHTETPHEHGSHGHGAHDHGPHNPETTEPSPQDNADARRRLSELARAIQADPTNKRLIIERINLAIAVDPSQAIQECQKILRDDPKNHFALQHIASAYLEAGDLDKALHYASLAFQQMETVDTCNVIAQVFYRRGMLDQAMMHYEKALAMDPQNEHARAAVAMINTARTKAR